MTSSPRRASIARTVAPFAILGFAEILIFFHDTGHFFIADTLTWMAHRYTSVGEFLRGFVEVDPGLWYRPLAQRTVVSLLFPIFGLQPLAYRIVGFILFFLCTIGVYLVIERLTASQRIAWFSVLVFAPHLIHTFPTYDAAFTPELLFTLFYIGSVLMYVRYLRTVNRKALFGSAVLFVGSLLSKEMAVALPFTLVAIWILLPREKQGRLVSLLPHFALLGLYLIFAIGYLHIRDLSFDDFVQSDVRSSEYSQGIGGHVFTNIRRSASWAFGISDEVHGYWTFDPAWVPSVLEVLRGLAVVGAIGVLFTRERRFLLLGVAWYLTAGAPAFLLINHFLPYYLFAPLIGFGLAMGTILDWVYIQARKVVPRAGLAIPVVVLTIWTVIHASTGRRIADEHVMLAGAARINDATVYTLRKLHPSLPKGTKLVLFNEEIPLARRHRVDLALQLAYDDPTLITYLSTESFVVPYEEFKGGNVLVLKWRSGHVTDLTPFVHQRPDLLVAHPTSQNYHLEATQMDGKHYRIRVPELPGCSVTILYAVDGKVMEPVQTQLDDKGESPFIVPGGIEPGTYTFVAVRRTEDETWVPINLILKV
ncbi:MAG TPA: glycosyltransferase family 39 protein, partial [Terriglobia bacterium]|nr:glycosyltransferase family 39 protein [Terriglobia bacterium]